MLLTLRSGGGDVGGFAQSLPAQAQAALRSVQPLPDPRQAMAIRDPVSPETVHALGTSMDLCWGAWMATGDPGYLRAIADLLGGAGDLPAFEAWKAAKGGEKGLSVRVVRGMFYQIAGWSIGSFERSDPRVADWIRYWRNDPSFPQPLRKELASLPANPAFRR
jgi:hypothetical protein